MWSLEEEVKNLGGSSLLLQRGLNGVGHVFWRETEVFEQNRRRG
jgi:hypothetical protein